MNQRIELNDAINLQRVEGELQRWAKSLGAVLTLFFHPLLIRAALSFNLLTTKLRKTAKRGAVI